MLQEDERVTGELQQVAAAIKEASAQHGAVQSDRESLLDRRYNCLVEAMTTVNAQLSRVYRFLTGMGSERI
jgi:hypothetical protein